MNTMALIEIGTLPVYVIPLLIFVARILDVSLGTLRIILVARSMRGMASILGFLEIVIWLLAIGQVMQNLNSIENYFAYAAGFAAGTYVGMTIERKLRIGTLLVRIVTKTTADALINHLTERGHRVTHVDAHGAREDVKVIFTVVKRSALNEIISIIQEFNPNAFYTVEDVRMAHQGLPIQASGQRLRHLLQPFYWFRKEK